MVQLGGDPVRAALARGVRRVAVVGVRRDPRPEDRHVRGRHRLGGDAHRPAGQHRRPLGLRPGPFPGDLPPSQVLRRNFWFCTIDDPSTIATRDVIGVENICFETDYPHGDGTWPDTQALIDKVYGDILSDDEMAMITHENAAALFRHPLPPPDSPHAAGLRS